MRRNERKNTSTRSKKSSGCVVGTVSKSGPTTGDMEAIPASRATRSRGARTCSSRCEPRSHSAVPRCPRVSSRHEGHCTRCTRARWTADSTSSPSTKATTASGLRCSTEENSRGLFGLCDWLPPALRAVRSDFGDNCNAERPPDLFLRPRLAGIPVSGSAAGASRRHFPQPQPRCARAAGFARGGCGSGLFPS